MGIADMKAGPVDGGELPRAGRWAGYAACSCAFLFAGVSFFWGLGFTFGLDTVGREAVELSKAGDPGVYLALWFVGFVKLGGGLLALALVRPWGRRMFRRWMLLAAGWGGTIALILYGSAQITIQLFVKSGVIKPPEEMDWRGFYGHLLLWDPWFVVWGVLLGITAFYYTRYGTARRSLR